MVSLNNMVYLIVSIVFVMVFAFVSIYILSPTILSPLFEILAPISGVFKYIIGQINLLIGG